MLVGGGVVIWRELEWYWALAIFVVAFICLNLVGSKQANRKLELYFSGRPVLNADEFGKHYFPLEQAEIAVRIRKILARHVGIDIARMNPADRFIEDLLMDDFDSMSTVEFVIEIEKEFNVEIPNAVAEKMTTFQSVVDYVAEALKNKTK